MIDMVVLSLWVLGAIPTYAIAANDEDSKLIQAIIFILWPFTIVIGVIFWFFDDEFMYK